MALSLDNPFGSLGFDLGKFALKGNVENVIITTGPFFLFQNFLSV